MELFSHGEDVSSSSVEQKVPGLIPHWDRIFLGLGLEWIHLQEMDASGHMGKFTY